MPGIAKPLLVELTGETEFHLGNPAAKIAVQIAIGYKKYVIPATGNNPVANNPDIAQQSVYASLTTIGQPITLADLIRSCTDKPVEIPGLIDAVGFRRFSVLYGSGGINATEFSLMLDCRIEINKKFFDLSLAIRYDKNKQGDTGFSFGGVLHVEEHRFDVQFKKTNSDWLLFASYRNERKITIDLRAIAGKFFGADMSSKMPALSFTLDKFKAFLVYKKSDKDPGLLFGMGAAVDLDVKDLPLAGAILSQQDNFQFKEVLAIYSSGSFSKEELKSFPSLPGASIEKGFNISASLLINGKPENYVLNSGADQKFPGTTPVANNAVTVTPGKTQIKDPVPVGGAASSLVTWKEVDKQIGPVTLQRLGFAYKDGKVVVLLDASMEMADMGMQLMGFGLGFELKWPPAMPDFYIDGIGLSYKVPPIEIAGAFLHAVQDYNGKQVHVYTGAALLKISWFTISAIGSYAKVEDQQGNQVASLFIYGVFDGPIGGPSFFFVTGIAAGFGYNRRVNVPSIDEVAMYPLVALAMKPEKGGSLMDMLQRLETPMKSGKKPIEISVGDYWLAIGIKFSSFKIIDSFVLVTVNFGTALEFAILGLSRLTWPDKAIAGGLGPIVYVELAILVHFGPASDVISVEAIITPNSYLLSRDCRLTGGFAFYTWIKGPHEGDFVITLGGYHSKFRKPAHYPNVPRLGLSWKIGDQLMIKGEMYFALCSSAIMAGGRWEVLFKTSVVSVTLIIWADMLISWAPFEYYIDIGVCLIIDLHILFHIHIELGARLQIYGPPFAGEIYVDLTIFSFTIPFGDQARRKQEPLSWMDFAAGFVPQKTQAPTADTIAAPPPPDPGVAALPPPPPPPSAKQADPLNITISDGLIDVKELAGKVKFPVINPYQLAISVESFVPSTNIYIKAIDKNSQEESVEVAADTPLRTASGNAGVDKYSKRVKDIGIRPCHYDSVEMYFELTVAVRLKGQLTRMSVTCLAKGVAEALWGPKPSDNTNDNPGTSKVIPDVLTGLLLQPPPAQQVATVREFDFSTLFEESRQAFDWNFPTLQAGPAYHNYEVLGDYRNGSTRGTLESTYSNLAGQRSHILHLLNTQFDAGLQNIREAEITGLMHNPVNYFKAAPILCGIGENPQYPTDTAA